jgi:Bacteriophage Sf6, terminase small subunit-like
METDNEQHESKTGRPTLKTPELCAEICRRISEGETMKAILKTPGMPAWTTVHEWKHADDSFRQALAHAREQQAEVWAEETKDLTDAELATHEEISRARLRMQSRQWLAGKYNPQFADKPSQTQVNVAVGVVLPEAERVKLLERRDRALLANQGTSGDSAPTRPEP